MSQPLFRTTLATLSLLLVLTGCSSTDKPEAPAPTTETKATEAAKDEKAEDKATQAKPTEAAKDEKADDKAASSDEKVAQFRALVPETMAFGAPMINFGQEGFVSKVADNVTVGNWSQTTALSALLSRKEAELAATPAYVAANLYNKDIDVRLVAGVVWGMIYVLGPEGSPEGDWNQLKGKKVGVLLPGAMPDLVFTAVLEANGLKKDDFEVVPVQEGPQLVGMLAKGEVDYGVAPEHLVTMAQMKAKKAGRTLSRPFNLQKEWAKAFGGEPRIPMAGLVMPGELVDAHPELVSAVLDELKASAEKVNALDETTVNAIAKKYELPAEVVKQIIPRLQVNIVPAKEMRKEYELFLEKLGQVNPKIYGGKLPDDKFYAGE